MLHFHDISLFIGAGLPGMARPVRLHAAPRASCFRLAAQLSAGGMALRSGHVSSRHRGGQFGSHTLQVRQLLCVGYVVW